MSENQKPEWVEVPTKEHAWGGLSLAESAKHIPFQIARVYWVHGIPSNAYRGGHSHHRGREVVFAVSGRCVLTLFRPDGSSCQWRLENPRRGVLVPPGWWIELDDFAESSVILVLAELQFAADNYERDCERFFDVRPLPHPVSRPRP